MTEQQIAEYERKVRQTPFAQLEKALSVMRNSKHGGDPKMIEIILKEIRAREARTAACNR